MIRSACPCDDCQDIIVGEFENVTEKRQEQAIEKRKTSILSFLSLDSLSLMLIACALAFLGSNVQLVSV